MYILLDLYKEIDMIGFVMNSAMIREKLAEDRKTEEEKQRDKEWSLDECKKKRLFTNRRTYRSFIWNRILIMYRIDEFLKYKNCS